MLLPTAARGTMTVLLPHAHHLSPAVGLALSAGGQHLLSNLYTLEPRVPIAKGARVSGDVDAYYTGSPSGALLNGAARGLARDGPASGVRG